jgi:uncharacterized protein YeeX (DUF496 family)
LEEVASFLESYERSVHDERKDLQTKLSDGKKKIAVLESELKYLKSDHSKAASRKKISACDELSRF